MMRGWWWVRIHVSWMIAIAMGAVVCGVAASQYAEPGMFVSVAWLLTGLVLVIHACSYKKAYLIVVVIIGGILIGLWRGSLTMADLQGYQKYYGNNAVLSGRVLEDKDSDKKGRTVVRLGDVRIDGRATTGSVWVTTRDSRVIRRSDRVTARGNLNEGFGTFAASMYDADVVAVTHVQGSDPALEVRDWFARGVERSVGSVEASLGLGYLTGQRRGLPEELDAALKAAGLTHIVVASGYNLTILVRFARRLFESVSKYLSFMTSLSMILAFIAVTGLSPSMSRAGLVAGLSLIAWYYGRRFHPMVLLPLAAGITVLIQPSYAWGDIGWLLSFAAFGGVMILAPLLNAYFFGDSKASEVRRIFMETISAQVATLPILMASFGVISIIAPVANMLVLPLVPLAMVFTFVAGIGGLIAPAFAQIIGFPAQILLQYMTSVITVLGSIPWAQQEVQVSVIVAVGMFVVLAAVAMYLRRATGYRLAQTSIIE